jgi:hypothetical protein
MVCIGQKLALAGSLAGLGGSGVIAVIGAPTLVLTAVGVAGAVAAFTGVIASMTALKDCYEAKGLVADVEKMLRQIAVLEEELAKLRSGK